MKLKYYHNLDGIRGIAALMVVIFHFFTYPNAKYLINISLYQRLTEFGQHGVSLFFVLSGFVITRILLNNRENKNYFQSFYFRRVLRILPLYYLFLFVYYIFTPLLTNTDGIALKSQMPFYFYLQNFSEILNIKTSGPGHYWSLAVEEHFYMLWPLVIYIVHPRYIVKLIGVIIFAVFVLKYYMLENGFSINKFTFTRIDQILLGAYLAVLELKGYFSKKNSLKIMLLIGISVLPLAFIVYVSSAFFPFLKEMTKYLFLGLIFFSLIGTLIALKEDQLINQILSGSILQYLGRISYGIYIWHVLALLILNKFLISQILIIDLLFTIGLTVIMAHFSYFYFEKIFLRFKDTKFIIKKT